ncbi:MAG: class I SAM-dependent methyltransferase [Acidimicrobiia bacterium]
MTSQLESGTKTANTEQAEVWNGHEGDHWAEHADHYERSNRHLMHHLVTGELISSDDAVLDIGCGTGKSTRSAARLATRGSALGVDLSAPMLAQASARSRADGLANVSFLQADAQVHPFGEQAFDVAISCYGAMFFADPVAAFGNIGRALRPGGRLALLAWREIARNEWLCELRTALALGRQLPEPPPDTPSPFALADPDRARRILGDAGYVDIGLEPIDEPIDFGADADAAYGFLRTLGIVEGLMHDLDDAQRAEALSQLRTTVDAHTGADGVLFGSSSWLITAARRLQT